MLEIKEIENKKIWEDFIERLSSNAAPLFQTWNWGEVQKKRGSEVIRIGFFKAKKMVGVAALFVIKAKRGNFIHVRHGPILLDFKKDFDLCMDGIKKIAQEKKVSFIRISPLIASELISLDFFKKRGYINSPIHKMDAEVCWVLDVTKSEEQLLSEMRKSHRYLIRKAQGMNIKIKKGETQKDLHTFLDLYKDLSLRKHFVGHKGIQEEFEIFTKDDCCSLFLAQYEGKVIAGALVIFMPKVAIYHHGASADAYRHIPASYLLQWEIIREIKKRNIPTYNFWGVVSPNDSKRHPWQGLSLFKTGFGGERKEYIHAKDLPLNAWYLKTYLIDFISKIKKGY